MSLPDVVMVVGRCRGSGRVCLIVGVIMSWRNGWLDNGSKRKIEVEETATEVWAVRDKRRVFRVRGAITRCISSLMNPMAETESRAQNVRNASKVVGEGMQGTKAVQYMGHATRLRQEA